jgi:hypothetical protein
VNGDDVLELEANEELEAELAPRVFRSAAVLLAVCVGLGVASAVCLVAVAASIAWLV